MAKTTGPRGPRGSAAAKSALEALLRARDRVDEEMVTRRQTEESALRLYAAAEAEAQQIEAEAERQMAELERQRQEISRRRVDGIAAVDAQRGEALLLLTEQGRSAEQLAEMTSLATKRVRVMIRDARQARQKREPSTVAAGAPAASAAVVLGEEGATRPVVESTP